MRKQQQAKSKVGKPKAKPRQPPQGQQNARWGMKLDKLNWGPLQLGGFGIDSGSGKRSMGHMAGLGMRSIDVQRKMPRFTSTVRDGGVQVDVLSGTDVLGAVSSGTGCKAGDLLFVQKINPSLFLHTRLAQFAPLYQRYRFKKVRFVYEPIASATQSGQVLGFCDFDVDALISENTPLNIQRGAAHQGQAISQIWDYRQFDMGQSPTFTDLFTDPYGDEPRLFIQGVFYLIAASDIVENLPLGNIYVEYEIEYSIPQLGADTNYLRGWSGTFGTVTPTAAPDGNIFWGQVSHQGESNISLLWPDQNHGALRFEAILGEKFTLIIHVAIDSLAPFTIASGGPPPGFSAVIDGATGVETWLSGVAASNTQTTLHAAMTITGVVTAQFLTVTLNHDHLDRCVGANWGASGTASVGLFRKAQPLSQRVRASEKLQQELRDLRNMVNHLMALQQASTAELEKSADDEDESYVHISKLRSTPARVPPSPYMDPRGRVDR